MSTIDNMTKLGTIDDIVRSLDNIGETELRETLAFLLKTYVIDGGLKSSGVETTAPPSNLQRIDNKVPKNYTEFRELIADLKQMYGFSELKLFSVEANKVYINISGEKYEIEGQGQNNDPGNNVAPSIREQVENDQKPVEPKNESPQEENGGGGRFSNLELD